MLHGCIASLIVQGLLAAAGVIGTKDWARLSLLKALAQSCALTVWLDEFSCNSN